MFILKKEERLKINSLSVQVKNSETEQPSKTTENRRQVIIKIAEMN